MTNFTLSENLDAIFLFLRQQPLTQANRFFRTIEMFIRDENQAIMEYEKVIEALKKANAPWQLTALFNQLSKNERWNRNLLIEIKKEAKNRGWI